MVATFFTTPGGASEGERPGREEKNKMAQSVLETSETCLCGICVLCGCVCCGGARPRFRSLRAPPRQPRSACRHVVADRRAVRRSVRRRAAAASRRLACSAGPERVSSGAFLHPSSPAARSSWCLPDDHA